MFRQVLDVLSSEWFWLPSNLTWADITNGPDKQVLYTEMGDVWYQIPMTIFILVLRVLLTKNVFVPLGKVLGVPDKKIKNIQSHPDLERAYKKSRKLENPIFLAKKLDMTERQVERWFRLRRNRDKPSTMVKFCESSWKTTFLFASVAFGFYNVWDKDWFWNIEIIVSRFPNEGLTRGEWWCYLVNTSFYWSLLTTHFNDVRRKDFWQMFLHHLVVIILLIISWRLNIFKYGMVILTLQDSSEIFLQLTKTIRYANLPLVLLHTSFALFVALWVVIRLYVYPVHIIWPIISSVNKVYGLVPVAVVGFSGLCVVMVLQLWWTWLIVVLIYNALLKKTYRDIRSSESEISDAEEEYALNKT